MLNIRKLISISLQLNIEACRIIKESLANKNLKKYLKDIDDPVTQADFKVQSMLIKGIRAHFPNLKVIGQETTQYEGQIQFDYKQLSEDFLPPAIKINQELPLEKLCLWIDPIDCTKGFISGKVEDVTVLMGLSCGQRAAVGIIGIPFRKVNQQRIYKPIVVFGSVESKQSYQYSVEDQSYKKLQIPQYDAKQVRIAISNNRFSEAQDNFIKNMDGRMIKAGGSGRKLMMVVRRQADMMIYLDANTYKWDTCAAEAIITAMGGYLTNPKGDYLNYDFHNAQTRNLEGIVCTLQKQLHFKAMKVGVNPK